MTLRPVARYYLFWPLQLVCWAAFPLAFPIAKALDAVLGKEIGLSYSRDELIALLSLHSVGGRTKRGPQGDLHDQEAKILQGVLKFSTKIANDVVTPLEYVQAISMDDVLDLKLMGKLYRSDDSHPPPIALACYSMEVLCSAPWLTGSYHPRSGHSRIPVYKGEKENLMGVIFIKDLIIVDPADNVPVTKVVEYFKHPLPIVSKDLGLLTLLDDFGPGPPGAVKRPSRFP
jgi:metal transporter CNNM